MEGADFVSEERDGISDIVPMAISGRCGDGSVPESWVDEEAQQEDETEIQGLAQH